jgi:hypothetical protein
MGGAQKKGWWDRTLTVAAIAAIAAIAGGGVGALVNYYGNRSLQSDQSRATARGIARVLESQLMNAEPRLELALREKRVIVPEATSAVSLGIDDEELLASNLSPDGWTEIATALSGLQLERKAMEPDANNEAALKARAGFGVPLVGPLLRLDRSLLSELRESVAALHPLSSS